MNPATKGPAGLVGPPGAMNGYRAAVAIMAPPGTKFLLLEKITAKRARIAKSYFTSTVRFAATKVPVSIL